LRPQSRTRLPQKKASCVAQAFAELGLGAEVHRPASQMSSRRLQLDSRTGELLPEEIPLFEEMRHGLVNTQRRLRELERSDAERKRRDEERRRRRQQRREERAARAAGMGPDTIGEPQRGEGSGRAGRSALRSAHLHLALRDCVRARELRFLRQSSRCQVYKLLYTRSSRIDYVREFLISSKKGL
jgi:hypothetical protein